MLNALLCRLTGHKPHRTSLTLPRVMITMTKCLRCNHPATFTKEVY